MELNPTHHLLKKVLLLKLAEVQEKNPHYSLRAFARDVGVHAASLSECFSDKRQFSPKMAKKIIEKLSLSSEKKEELIGVLDNNGVPVYTDIERAQLDNDHYFIVSDPIYYSILCLLETKSFKEDHQWMAKRLKTSVEHIEVALERLERVKLLLRTEQGKLIYNGNAHLNTTDDIASASLRLRHIGNLDGARDALVNLPVDQRYFNFETLALSLENIPEAKRIINEARSKLVQLSTNGDKDEVYEFCFNFFPRTTNESQIEKDHTTGLQ